MDKVEKKEKIEPINVNTSPEERKSLLKRGLCEAIGISGLTFLACGVGTQVSESMTIAFAFGAVIFLMAYSIGNISGCHINPAISLNMLIRKQLTLGEFLVYIVSQFIGAILGSFLLAVCLRFDFHNLCTNTIQRSIYKNETDKDFWTYLSAVIAEAILTFFFVTAVNAATDKKYSDTKFAGFIIGCTLMLGVACGLNITGGSLNPFRSLAPAIFEAMAQNTLAISEIWVYIIGPFGGATIAAIVYMILF